MSFHQTPAESARDAAPTRYPLAGIERPPSDGTAGRVTVTDEMVEVAALASFIEGGIGEDATDWEDEHPGARKSYRDNARAIVTAVAPLIAAQAMERAAAIVEQAGRDVTCSNADTGRTVSAFAIGVAFAIRIAARTWARTP